MSGAVPPFPNTPSWRGAQLKRRDNFTYNFTLFIYLNYIKSKTILMIASLPREFQT
jgi:hypothetical protein